MPFLCKCIGSAIATWLGFILIRNIPAVHPQHIPGHFLMDSLNLGIHEAGHFLFFLTRNIGGTDGIGRFMYSLGGSLLEWSVPLCCTLYFVRTKQFYAASSILIWFAFTMYDSSIYAASTLR